MAHLQEPVFHAEDPRGYIIHCTREQWIFHVVSNRKFMGTDFWITQSVEAIRDPLAIYSDADYPDRENYYRVLPTIKGRQRYIKIVVVVDRVAKLGVVKTALPTDSPKRTERLIWTVPSD